MKKIIIFCFLLLFPCTSFSLNRIILENSSVTVPDTGKLYITMENDEQINGINIILKFDADKIHVTNIRPIGRCELISYASGHVFSDDKISLVVYDESASQIPVGNDRIFEVHYVASDPLVTDAFTTLIECFQGLVADSDLNEIEFDYINGVITVTPDPMLGIEIVVNEIVADPQQDWNDSQNGNGIAFDLLPGSGEITGDDEWIELYNAGTKTVDLTELDGWSLELIDATPEILFFDDPGGSTIFRFSRGGSLTNFQPDEYLIIGNPPGSLDDQLYLVLKNNENTVIDDVEIGDDPESDGVGDGAPDGGSTGGNATGIDDEAIARIPNSHDSDNDITDFSKKNATIGFSNDGERIFTYEFSEVDGAWYMVSLPVIPSANKVSDIFPSALANIALRWDHDDYVATDTLDTAVGYWIAMPGDTTVSIVGIPVDSFTIHFPDAGWYMIGSAIKNIGFSDPDDDPDNSILTPAFRYNSQPGLYEQTDSLFAGEGTWVAVLQECELNIGKIHSVAMSDKKTLTSSIKEFISLYGETPPLPPRMDLKNYIIPKRFLLRQSYPNPFNPSATIEYGIPRDCHVTITIYNVLGQEVRRLVDKPFKAGYHHVIWNGTNDAGVAVSSGVYIYQIQATGFINSRKMILLK